jgi:hypothetical protein
MAAPVADPAAIKAMAKAGAGKNRADPLGRIAPVDRRADSTPGEPCPTQTAGGGVLRRPSGSLGRAAYSMIVATTPAPTVRPPSRMAKRSFSSMAIGAISSTSNFRLSPGITISVPSGSFTVPVTSVVRK